MTPDAAGAAIEGYASEPSALPGSTLHLHVSTTPSSPYRVELYRLGWYGGAGARLVDCEPGCDSWRPGASYPVSAPDANGRVVAGWPVTDEVAIPAGAVSGYYLVRFLLPDGAHSSTYVIVRAPAPDAAAVLVQVPVNTWQAYNGWGGKSLYAMSSGGVPANRVSFDRPYAWSLRGGQGPLGWEYPLVLFLEQTGLDVSYQTDVDTDADPGSLLRHRLVVVAGHDEYWTRGMWDGFHAAAAAGVNLAFMGANDAYWQVRYEDGGRTVVGYKSPADPIPDPQLKTVQFRALARPELECGLIGVQHQGGSLRWGSGDYTVAADALRHRWFRGTGFQPGDSLAGLVSTEADTIPGDQPPDLPCGNRLTVFFRRDMGGEYSGDAAMVSHALPSGARVFAAGSLQLSWGLADPPPESGRVHGLVDPRLRQFVRNMLRELAAPHGRRHRRP